MNLSRRASLALGIGALASPLVVRDLKAQAQITLRLHHFLPPASNGQQRFLAPWAQRIEQASGGRLRIQIFPAMQLGGAPPQLFDQARDGVADIVWTLPGNTPGRFPRIEAFELPFFASRRAITNSRALQEYGEQHLGEEFREVKPLCWWAHDHGVIHANKRVARLEDMAGLRLRFPTRLCGEALRALGAQAIGMPIPQVPESLAQRVLDGTVVPWEVVPAIRVHELVRYHTEIPGSPTLYTATFVLAMNRARYDGLPADLRQILDANSGMVAASMAGEAWDAAAEATLTIVRARQGNTITTLPEEEVARFRTATQPVMDTWLRQATERGLPAERLLADARAALQKYA
ncbi:MAG: TRAP transporter substrate-binding protein [Roseomonas sp.]|jgi:TRAP-type C4-dicarboxylate transport system substrate-binding protein|nr:TRAP transporter substrate-binding protein [Roseomonas sp.]